MKRLGLIVNPIAGIGGRAGLKGSDGADVVARARALGGVAEAPQRAASALEQLGASAGQVEIVTFGGPMGEDVTRAQGLTPILVGRPRSEATTADDTRAAAVALAEAGVDLLLFAGGDGTARDIYAAIGARLPVLGIPAGVKIHSAAFATTPRAAGQLAALYLDGRVTGLRDAEVMDIDEDAFRDGRVERGPVRHRQGAGGRLKNAVHESRAIRIRRRAPSSTSRTAWPTRCDPTTCGSSGPARPRTR